MHLVLIPPLNLSISQHQSKLSVPLICPYFLSSYESFKFHFIIVLFIIY